MCPARTGRSSAAWANVVINFREATSSSAALTTTRIYNLPGSVENRTIHNIIDGARQARRPVGELAGKGVVKPTCSATPLGSFLMQFEGDLAGRGVDVGVVIVLLSRPCRD